MEKELTIKIDLEKITKDLLEKETYLEGSNGYSILENQVKNDIKQQIRERVVSEIKDSLNLEEFQSSGYSGVYLKETAIKILNEELGDKIKEHAETWIKQNIRWIIEKQVEKNIEKFIIPRMQKMISNLIVVNIESVEKEMEELKNGYESQIKDIEESVI